MITPQSAIITRGSQLFAVDPKVTNEGRPTPAGAIVNYPYRLPFLGHNFPVRNIRYVDGTKLKPAGSSPASPANVMLTLRTADGTYLLRDCPAFEFVQLDRVPFTRLFFDRNFFPDPTMSYVTFNAVTWDLAIFEFLYS